MLNPDLTKNNSSGVYYLLLLWLRKSSLIKFIPNNMNLPTENNSII